MQDSLIIKAKESAEAFIQTVNHNTATDKELAALNQGEIEEWTKYLLGEIAIRLFA